MARYRKKSVVIDAHLYDGEWAPVMAWLDHLAGGDGYRIPIGSVPPIRRDSATRLVTIDTLEGAMTARPGDWIIRGVAGEFYPCRPYIFAQTYESVDVRHDDG